jgi:hypothetical protein
VEADVDVAVVVVDDEAEEESGGVPTQVYAASNSGKLVGGCA